MKLSCIAQKYLCSIMGTLIFALMVFVIFVNPNEGVLSSFLNFSYILIALVSVLATYRAYSSLDKHFIEERKMWLLIMVSLALRAFGEFFWWFYDNILKISTPTLSVADVFWHLAYVLIIIALAFNVKQMFFENKRTDLLLLITICSAISFIYLYLNINHMYSVNPETIYSNVANLVYVVWDVFVVALLIFVSHSSFFGSGSSKNPLLLMTIAFILFGVYDALFAEQIHAGTYLAPYFIDIIYAAGYLFLILAANSKFRLITSNGKK